MVAAKGNKYRAGKPNPNAGRHKVFTDEAIDQEADALLEWIEHDSIEKLYIGSFARQRGYCRQRLSEFVKSNKKFADAYREAMVWQEEKFMKNALTRTWDPGFTARCMARVCGSEWKNSWDQPEERSDIPATVIINKIEK